MTGYLHPNVAPFRFEGSGEDEVVFVHGWTGSPAHLRPMAAALADAGVHVTAPLLAGHGTSELAMTTTTWRDWVRSAAEAAQAVTDRGHRLHLAGLSMGGVISLLLAPAFDAATVTTINAPIKVYSWQTKFAPLFRGSKTIRDLPAEDPPDDETTEYWQHYEDQPVGTIADLFDLVRAARRNLSRVTSPALIVQSSADETVKPVSAQLIFDGISSIQKRILWLHRSRHVSTLDVERHRITAALLAHIGRGFG